MDKIQEIKSEKEEAYSSVVKGPKRRNTRSEEDAWSCDPFKYI